MRKRGTVGLCTAVLLLSGCQTAVPESDLPSEGVLSVGDVSLRWVREGAGPPLYVIGSSVYYPKAYSASLRDHFELIFVDGRHLVPDYDPGADALAAQDIGTFAADVEALRLELGHERITVVGHSIHGQIALHYADLYPGSTAAVVLIGAVPYRFGELAVANESVWEELASDERRRLMAERLEGLQARLDAAPRSRQFAEQYIQRGPLYWADPKYDAKELLAGVEDGPAFAVLTSSLPTRHEALERLHRIGVPILLVLGKLDFAVAYTAWEGLIEGIDNLDYVLMEEDSHNPQTESPERFDPILLEWMQRSGG